MDASDADPRELARSLRFIERINWSLGYTRQLIGHLEQASRGWSPGERITIADFATGSADVPAAIVRWSRRRGLDVRIVAFDLHAATAKLAREAVERDRLEDRLHITRASAMQAPFADGGVDYAISSMFMHHLDDDQVVRVLREMGRVARRGILVSDLLRNRRAYRWITLFTLAAGPMVRHDARVSVAQAFTPAELERLAQRAGLRSVSLRRHFGHRMVLSARAGGE
jgi:ubiquinone/menaquinone biosynthesis C-methylase UbiE